ncbi:MFS transporter [Candidatus Woesearchaeota archaeon]|nr:MFS transporter [Candidatus Woesearchaeota archaeon]
MSKVLSGKIVSWALFDLGNTAHSALIVTLFFPVLIKNYLGGNEFMISLVIGLSLVLAALIVPFVGGISDATNIKRPFLMLFSVTTIFFVILIGSFTSLYLALIFALIANLSYHVTLDIYDSYITNLTTPKNYGFVSGFGVAMGYLGTIFSLIMAWILLDYFGWDTLTGIRVIFPATAFFFLFFAIPIFFVRDENRNETKIREGAIISFREVSNTIKGIKKYKNVWKFLLASFFYTGAVNTAISFLFLFGQEQLDLSIKQFIPIFGMMALSSAIGAYIFGLINDEIGPKKSLITALILWISVISVLLIETNFITYIMTGMVGGALLGAIWTSTRPMLIHIAPKEKITELFGFQGLTEKTGGLTVVFYGLLTIVGGHKLGVTSILFFLIMGLIMLSMVKEIQHEDIVEDY